MECVRKSCSELPFTTRSGSDHATLCVFLYQAGPEVIAEGKDIVRVNVTNNDRRYIWARTIREELVRVDQKKVLDPAKTEEMIARQYRTPFDDPVWKCRLLDARTGREIGWKFWNYVDCSDNSAGEKLVARLDGDSLWFSGELFEDQRDERQYEHQGPKRMLEEALGVDLIDVRALGGGEIVRVVSHHACMLYLLGLMRELLILLFDEKKNTHRYSEAVNREGAKYVDACDWLRSYLVHCKKHVDTKAFEKIEKVEDAKSPWKRLRICRHVLCHRLDANGTALHGHEMVLLNFVARCFGGPQNAVTFFYRLLYENEEALLFPDPEEFELFGKDCNTFVDVFNSSVMRQLIIAVVDDEDSLRRWTHKLDKRKFSNFVGVLNDYLDETDRLNAGAYGKVVLKKLRNVISHSTRQYQTPSGKLSEVFRLLDEFAKCFGDWNQCIARLRESLRIYHYSESLIK